jgi:hypothetical protein
LKLRSRNAACYNPRLGKRTAGSGVNEMNEAPGPPIAPGCFGAMVGSVAGFILAVYVLCFVLYPDNGWSLVWAFFSGLPTGMVIGWYVAEIVFRRSRRP